jgi:hypothetical protein
MYFGDPVVPEVNANIRSFCDGPSRARTSPCLHRSMYGS